MDLFLDEFTWNGSWRDLCGVVFGEELLLEGFNCSYRDLCGIDPGGFYVEFVLKE